jgi:putative endopeptidase
MTSLDPLNLKSYAVLRANMQLSNLPEFQDFYKLTPEDKMYLAKDKMVEIW